MAPNRSFSLCWSGVFPQPGYRRYPSHVRYSTERTQSAGMRPIRGSGAAAWMS